MLRGVPRPAPNQVQIGAAVRQLRDQRQLSREALADRAGTDVSYISKVEFGTVSPGWEKLRSLLEGLEIGASEFLRLAEDLAESEQRPDQSDTPAGT